MMDELIDYIKRLCEINHCQFVMSWVPKGWEVEIVPLPDSVSTFYFFDNKADNLLYLLCLAVRQVESQGARLPEGERVWELPEWTAESEAIAARRRYESKVAELRNKWAAAEGEGNELYKEAKNPQ